MPQFPVYRAVTALNPHLKRERINIALYKYADIVQRKAKDPREVEYILAEAKLFEKSSPCLFIQTESLARFLYESTYSWGIFKQAISDFDFKHICFPAKSINGINLRPCAFGNFAGIQTSEIGLPNVTNRVVFTCGLPGGNIGARIWDIDAADELLSKREMVDEKFPQDDIAFLHIRLCMAAVVYAAAFPDCIRNGMPDDIAAPHLHSPRTLTAAHEILEGATRTSVSIHIRAGHFRCLRDERYKRNEDGTPKIVFVRQTVVAGKLTPKTAFGL